MSSFSWQGLDFIGRHFLSSLKVSTSALNSLHLFTCLVFSCLLILTRGVLSCSELGAPASTGEGTRGKERKARFSVLFCFVLFSLLVQKSDHLGGRRFRQSWWSQHRGDSAPWRGSYLHLALSGTPPSPIFPWNTFAIRSSLPPQFFRTHVLPRLRVSVAVGSWLWAWVPHPCPTPSHSVNHPPLCWCSQ